MAAANSGDTVCIHYTGKLKDVTVFDSSDGREPLEFTIGQNMIIPTLEAAVIGMNIGDTDTVEIDAEDAYGPHMPEAIQSVERSMIPDEVELEIGVQIQATTPDGEIRVLTVVELDDTAATLDGNHPLAGEDLTFEIEFIKIVAQAV
jgi:peptidylprolyl isomerase